MVFPLSFTRGQRQNALKPPGGWGAAIFASLGVNSPNPFTFAPFSSIWGSGADAPGVRGERGSALTPGPSGSLRELWDGEGVRGNSPGGSTLGKTGSGDDTRDGFAPLGYLAQRGAAPASPGAQAGSSPLIKIFLFILEHEPRPHQGPAVPVLLMGQVGLQQTNPQGTCRGHCGWQGELQRGDRELTKG